jgi:hypothetical protein
VDPVTRQELLFELVHGAHPAAEMTLKAFARLWLESKALRLARSTAEKYASALDLHILPDLGDFALSVLTSRDIESWVVAKAKPLQPSTVNSLLGVLQAVLRAATREYQLADPSADVAALPTERPEDDSQKCWLVNRRTSMPTNSPRVVVSVHSAKARLAALCPTRRAGRITLVRRCAPLLLATLVTACCRLPVDDDDRLAPDGGPARGPLVMPASPVAPAQLRAPATYLPAAHELALACQTVPRELGAGRPFGRAWLPPNVRALAPGAFVTIGREGASLAWGDRDHPYGYRLDWLPAGGGRARWSLRYWDRGTSTELTTVALRADERDPGFLARAQAEYDRAVAADPTALARHRERLLFFVAFASRADARAAAADSITRIPAGDGCPGCPTSSHGFAAIPGHDATGRCRRATDVSRCPRVKTATLRQTRAAPPARLRAHSRRVGRDASPRAVERARACAASRGDRRPRSRPRSCYHTPMSGPPCLLCLLCAVTLGCATGAVTVEGDDGGRADSAAPATDGAHDGSPAPDSRSGLPLGATCTTAADCASLECLPLSPGGPKVCVTTCATQADCGEGADYFCDPTTAGAPNGYCMPRSPVHCMTCTADADCGGLSEACVQAPGDTAKTCHVDCALAGASACPPDYACTDVSVGGATRKLCTPTSPAACVDAQGGFCDRVTTAQACTRANADGTCTGQRTCDADTQRYGACGATVPACKATCTTPDPAGCQLAGCAGAATTPDHCGTCDHACPGWDQASAEVTCNAPDCTFACKGEQYDVNGLPDDGCELADNPTGNHTQTAATNLGSLPCDDVASQINLNGILPSDGRVHQDPTIDGFNATTGAAPDWFKVYGSGGTFCLDDVTLTLQVFGASNPACFALTAITDKATYSCQTMSGGTCNFAPGTSSYSDGTDIFIKVEKTCTGVPPASIAYKVTGHL